MVDYQQLTGITGPGKFVFNGAAVAGAVDGASGGYISPVTKRLYIVNDHEKTPGKLGLTVLEKWWDKDQVEVVGRFHASGTAWRDVEAISGWTGPDGKQYIGILDNADQESLIWFSEASLPFDGGEWRPTTTKLPRLRGNQESMTVHPNGDAWFIERGGTSTAERGMKTWVISNFVDALYQGGSLSVFEGSPLFGKLPGTSVKEGIGDAHWLGDSLLLAAGVGGAARADRERLENHYLYLYDFTIPLVDGKRIPVHRIRGHRSNELLAVLESDDRLQILYGGEGSEHSTSGNVYAIDHPLTPLDTGLGEILQRLGVGVTGLTDAYLDLRAWVNEQ